PVSGGAMSGIISISSILTNPEMTMVLHALEQKSGANLLSAPKVTTKSGANAEIKVVEEYIYPTEFTLVTPPASGSTQGSQTPMAFVQPEGFQTRDTGVILNVTPTVGPDGFSIDLVMLPQVCELTEWKDYGTQYPNPTGVGTYFLSMPQPIFKSRNITTSITIWDGQTVVMGGMISEKQATTLDKIPILGDIPLLGYLFQSKTSNSRKYNLLIFVTANLVDPAGNKINKELITSAVGTVSTPVAAASQANP
ncbi:MAG: type II and III secretion system protein, partial [Kiritimatiellota bacterium]|nr:type II and III secretion system protein [Kiritimatiellota bacterium]